MKAGGGARLRTSRGRGKQNGDGFAGLFRHSIESFGGAIVHIKMHARDAQNGG